METLRRIARWRRRLVSQHAGAGGMNFRKIALFLGIAFVLYYVIEQPAQTAAWFRGALGGVGDAAGRLAEFVRQLVR